MANSNTFNSKMKNNIPKKIIVCGTDTDVGKTILSAFLVQGLNAVYWKPIQSGTEDGGDTGRICRLLNLKEDRYFKEAYKFKAPVSPHWAAEQENILINRQKLEPPRHKSTLIIETAGGLMVPLTRDFLQIDQIKSWEAPVILVARSELGTLNHTFLSLEAMKNRKISVLGVFLNGANHIDNPKTIREIGNIPIIGHLPYLKKVCAETLSSEWEKQKVEVKLKKLFTKFY